MPDSISHYRNIFDTMASHYWIVDAVSLGIAGRLRKDAIRAAHIQTGSTVVDLMCGTGNNILDLDVEKKRISYIGLDASEKMIHCAFDKNRLHSHEQFVQVDILSCPASLKGDHILCSYGLKCISYSDYTAFADLISRIMKEQSTFSFVEFQFPRNRLLKLLMKAYLQSIYRLFCYWFISDTTAVRALLQNLEIPVQAEVLAGLLQANHFEVNIDKRFNDSIIFISGKKM